MLELIHRIIWGPWLMALFLAAGLLYTFRFRFFQIRRFPAWWKATAGSFFPGNLSKDGDAGNSQLKDRRSGKEQIKTACTALAATVGTGNIVGVATAITAGGPGALFWMWMSAILGMMTAYGEVYLGIESRFRAEDGRFVCGPFVYLERMAGKRGMAFLYALLCLCCSLGMGSMVQANSMAETAGYSFRFPKAAAALALGILTMWVIRGGQKKIGQAAAALVPFSAGFYLLFSILVLVLCRRSLPGVLGGIFREAFRFKSAAGGAAGFTVSRAIRFGLARGVFSNEAGLGSMAVLHGEAPGQDPGLQGMWAMFEVFFDTVVVCTLTGLVILCGLKEAGICLDGQMLSGAALTSWCFSNYLGKPGEWLIAFSLMLFAFATIIAWYYLGSQALFFLVKDARPGQRSALAKAYRLVYLAAVCMGCVSSMDSVWLLSDICNGLMALPNLTALFLLIGRVKVPNSLDKKSTSLYTESVGRK